eukprot:1327848-Amorphochlora_amoeboformis.AAC.1
MVRVRVRVRFWVRGLYPAMCGANRTKKYVENLKISVRCSAFLNAWSWRDYILVRVRVKNKIRVSVWVQEGGKFEG